MNKLYFLFCGILFSFTSILAQPLTTIRVDMSGETVVTDGVHIAGSFNGWNTSINEMIETSPGSGIYEFSIDADDYGNVNVNDNVEYKILNGNEWNEAGGGGETFNSLSCTWTHTNNRVFTVPASPKVLPTFTFNGCPADGGTTSMTFYVDVAGQTIGPNGPHVVGEFIGWNNPGNLPMSQVGSTTVYSVTTDIPSDLKRLNFKYLLDNNYNNAESFSGGSCVNGQDRFYDVPETGPGETEVYFYGTCNFSMALPIELTSFTATVVNAAVEIDWVTAQEEGVDYFRLEHSTNQRDFALLEEVRAIGNSRSARTYQVEDVSPASGTNYYRLITVDLDGTEHNEGLRSVSFRSSSATAPVVFPNPVTDQMNIAFLGTAKINIIDALGRLVHQGSATDGYSWAGIATLKSGYYYLQLETSTGITQTTFLKK